MSQEHVACADAAELIGNTVDPLQLLELWKSQRELESPMIASERSLIDRWLFDSWASDRASVVTVTRLKQPVLLGRFCKEENASVQREKTSQRKHRESMFLHGTRWGCISPICSEGLDPE
jgi:hypothetical protein